MAISTIEEYKAGLRDGRAVLYQGDRVDDVTAHAAPSPAVDHSSLFYSIHHLMPQLAVEDVFGVARGTRDYLAPQAQAGSRVALPSVAHATVA
jgi:aromatic ring hydroxylase